ncbi:MAG: toxin CcdB [Polaribacter sp.]|jgi:toxin CcdB
MPQFDIYANPNKKSSSVYPFIINMQNDLIDDLATRIVAPLALYSKFKDEELKKLTPRVSYKEQELLILIPQITSMPARLLKEPIGSLSHLRDEIIAALDFAIIGI